MLDSVKEAGLAWSLSWREKFYEVMPEEGQRVVEGGERSDGFSMGWGILACTVCSSPNGVEIRELLGQEVLAAAVGVFVPFVVVALPFVLFRER